MNRIIAIAALVTIVLAAYGASANPFDNSDFPNSYSQSRGNAPHHK